MQPVGQISAGTSSSSDSNFKQGPFTMNNPFGSMVQGSSSTSNSPLSGTLGGFPNTGLSQSSFVNGIQGNGQQNGHLMSAMQYGPMQQLISALQASSNYGGSGRTMDGQDATTTSPLSPSNNRRKRSQITALESLFTNSNPSSETFSSDSSSSMDRTKHDSKPSKKKGC